MRQYNEELISLKSSYDISKIVNTKDILFVDIETTGLSPKNSHIYIIGCIYMCGGVWNLTQFFAESADEEKELLEAFLQLASRYGTFIHFNGNKFDMPFIKARCESNGLSFDPDAYDGIDLYKRITPYKHVLHLNNCKQKSIEEFLGINRVDEFSGGELIKVYKEYIASPDDELYTTLFRHNYDDMIGMIQILPILAYGDLFTGELHVTKVTANTYSDVYDNKRKELLITFSIPSTLPTPFAFNACECYLSVKGNSGILKIPVYQEEMKYYYDNYKDYYYLPEEDMAIHKSVAVYVDKNFRKQAAPSTCYTRKSGEFLPQWDIIFTPFFKKDYDSKNTFFEMTDDIKHNREQFDKYINHIVLMMINYK